MKRYTIPFLSLLLVPMLSWSQCNFTASIGPLSCSTHPTFEPSVRYLIDISGGTPPYSVYANGVNLVATYYTASVSTVLEAYDCAIPFSITDGTGCSDSNFSQNPTIIPEPADFIVPFDVNGDSGLVFDAYTGLVDIRITSTNGVENFTSWDNDYQYDLTGPMNVTGIYGALPIVVWYRYISDLPQGNYSVTMTNTGSGVHWTGCSYFNDCNLFNFAPLTYSFVAPPPPFTLGDAGVNVTPQIALQGAMPSSGTLMDDHLRSAGMLPLIEPYTVLGYSFSDPASAGSTIPQSMLNTTGNDAIVDWVVVELRASTVPYAVVASQPALLQRDGDVVDLDGDDYVNFFNLAEGEYRVAVRHRNHLGTMSDQALALGLVPKEVSLRDGNTFGTDATTAISGVQCLWAGNCNFDDKVSYTGSGNDRDPILVEIGGSVPTNTTSAYSGNDVNMDGTISYTGASNDRDPMLVNIGGSVPTQVRTEQLP